MPKARQAGVAVWHRARLYVCVRACVRVCVCVCVCTDDQWLAANNGVGTSEDVFLDALAGRGDELCGGVGTAPRGCQLVLKIINMRLGPHAFGPRLALGMGRRLSTEAKETHPDDTVWVC